LRKKKGMWAEGWVGGVTALRLGSEKGQERRFHLRNAIKERGHASYGKIRKGEGGLGHRRKSKEFEGGKITVILTQKKTNAYVDE